MEPLPRGNGVPDALRASLLLAAVPLGRICRFGKFLCLIGQGE
ncbi:hypothetical protein ABZY02_18140 [Streptomyces sp. NPDC006649]